MTSAAKAMSHFSSNLSRPSKFGTAQGFGPTLGRLSQTSTLPVTTSSPATSAGVLLVAVGSPTPPASQSRGASEEFARTLSELLYSAPPYRQGETTC